MARQIWKPGNMLYPVPAVLVSCADREGRSNIFTVAWAGTVSSDPPMVSISVRKSRYSYHMIEETGEFALNLTTEKMVRAVDLAGVISGRDTDKWKRCGLTPEPAEKIGAPIIKESPAAIECRVREKLELGSHDMFVAEVLSVDADEAYFGPDGRFALEKTGLIAYVHGSYFSLGKRLGSFGYSVRKRKTKK